VTTGGHLSDPLPFKLPDFPAARAHLLDQRLDTLVMLFVASSRLGDCQHCDGHCYAREHDCPLTPRQDRTTLAENVFDT